MLNRASRVLIVDDREANHLAITSVLEPLALEVHHAHSGDEALQLILQFDFSIILMDVEMPGLDGYETTRLIHNSKRFKHLPIVMVTGRDANREEHIKAYDAGAIDYITKPIEPRVLLSKVQLLCELHHQRQSFQQSSASMQALLNSAGEGILGIDLCGAITFANPKACELLKATRGSLMGQQLQNFLLTDGEQEDGETSKEASQPGRADIGALLQSQAEGSRAHKQRWLTANGNSFHAEYSCEITHDKQGKSNGGVVVFQNITERKMIEEQLVSLANFDPLTNLANRAYFHDALTRAVARAKRSHSQLALLFIDLDHFKHINDSLGHDAGDLLLQKIGERVGQSIRSGDLAARIGGDEFAVILHDLNSNTDTLQVAEKISASINVSIDLQGSSINTTSSIGIAIFDDKRMGADDLVKAADTAMYAAKHEGRNNYQFFNAEMQRKAEEKTRLQLALQQAIANGELTVHYQPKVSLHLNRMVGLEALVRWTDAEGVNIPPDRFIPIAEESGLIHELGAWVFRHVCQQLTEWQELPEFADLVVSINVSAQQLKAGDFHQFVDCTLTDYQLPAASIELELTETTVMGDPDVAIRELQAISELGVQISIDDFGTGYSSLSYLNLFPIDTLKIDKCFVQDIGDNNYGEEIIKLVVAIAKTMDVEVIAEGVETDQQLAFLSNIGCQLVQGYYFSKPLDRETITALIKKTGADQSSQLTLAGTTPVAVNLQALSKVMH